MDIFTKRNRVTDEENKFMVTKGKGGKGDTGRLQPTCRRVHTNRARGSAGRHGDSAQRSVVARTGKEPKKEWVHVCAVQSSQSCLTL